MTDYSYLFEGERFPAPEGTVTAEIKSVESAGDRVSFLLWFYGQAGAPLHDNLTLTLSAGALSADAGGQYRRRILSEVQNWLTGIRDGEPLQVVQ